MKRVSPGKVKDGEMIWGGGSPGIAWDSDSFFKVGWESVRTLSFPHRQNMRAKSSHESKGHIRFSGQGMEVESVQPSWDVASQTARPSAEVTPGPAPPSFVLGKGWHTAERKYDPQKPGQEEPLGQMLKGNQVSGEGRQGQAAWLGTFFQQE